MNSRNLFIFMFFAIGIALIIVLVLSISKSNSKENPGKCLILTQKNCSSGKVFDWNYQGKTYKLVGFRLSKGASVFAPRNGELVKTKAVEPFTGLYAAIRDLNDSTSTNIEFAGDLMFDKTQTVSVKDGNLIGTIGNTGVKEFGDYNLILFLTRKNPQGKGFITDINMLKQLFSSIIK